MSNHTLLKILQQHDVDYEELVGKAASLRAYKILADLIPKCAQRLGDRPSWDVLNLAQHAEMEFVFSDYHWAKAAISERDNKERRISWILTRALEDYSLTFNMPLYDGQRGLPLHAKDATGNLVPAENTEDGRFVLRYMKEGHWSGDYSENPSWATKIFIKKSDYDVYNLFYSDLGDDDKNVIEAKTRAIRNYIAGSVDGAEPKQGQRSLGTREKRTLLVIIAALAKHAKIDVEKHEKAGHTIAALTEEVGAAIDHQTIANKLKEIPDAIQSKAK